MSAHWSDQDKRPADPFRGLKPPKKPVSEEQVRHIDHDLEILDAFAKVYCRKTHGSAKNTLCPECADLLRYADQRRIQCPLDPKPTCKGCPVHCYKPEMRARIREIMRVAGMHFILRGRLDWAFKYFWKS